jgi:hypothetical protein
MSKKPIRLKIVIKGDDKFIERIFADGSWDMIPAPPKVQTRRPRRPAMRIGSKNKTRQNQFLA